LFEKYFPEKVDGLNVVRGSKLAKQLLNPQVKLLVA
jgi:hypothetical protein